MDTTVSIGKAAQYVGRSPSYLRLLDESGVLAPDSKTSGGHRRYSVASLDQFLASLASTGVCLVYLGIPDLDFPSPHTQKLRERCFQSLVAMGFVGLEDVTPPATEGDFYKILPALISNFSKPGVSRIAISHSECIPMEAQSTLLSTAAAFGVQVLFLNLK